MTTYQRQVLLLLLLLLGPIFAHSLPVHLEKRKSNALFKRGLEVGQSWKHRLTTPFVVSVKGKNEEIRNQSNAFDKFRIITDPTEDTSVDNQHKPKTHHKTENLTELDNDIIPGEYLVQLKTGLTASMEEGASKLQSIMDEFETEDETPSIEDNYEIGNLRIIVIKGSPQFRELLAKNDLIEIISPNRYFQFTSTQENAPWNLERISRRAPASEPVPNYDYSNSTRKDIDVYVLDTGIDTSHREFEGRASWGFAYDWKYKDLNGHGTHVAGIIGSKTYGVAKEANLIAVKVADAAGKGTTYTIIAGINFVYKACQKSKRKSIVNISIGSAKDKVLNNAVSQLLKSGVHVVVAAGNQGIDACKKSPASTPGVLAVGAVDKNDKRATFSNFGKCVSLFAPGVDIESTFLDHSAKILSGTSLAAPHVSGIVALLLSQYPGKFESVKETFDYVKMIATKNRLSQIKNSVNLLAYNGFVDGEEQNPAPSKPIYYSDWTNLIEKDFVNGIAMGKINVNQGGPAGITPLSFAIRSSYDDAIPILLTKKAEASDQYLRKVPKVLNTIPQNDDERFAIHNAIIDNNEKSAKLLIDANVDIHAKDNHGRTPMLLCVLFNRVNIAKMLIQKDTRIIQESSFQWKALSYYTQSIEMTQLLVNGVDLLNKNHFMEDLQETVIRLLERDDSILRSVNFRGKSLLQLAIKNGNEDLAYIILHKIKELKESGKEYLSIVNALSKSFKTAWNYAIDMNFYEIADRLVELGSIRMLFSKFSRLFN